IGLRILLTHQLMVTHTISIGEYTASTFAVWSLFSGLNGLSSSLHSLSEHSMKADKIFRFLKEEPQIYVKGKMEPRLQKQNKILCQNLSFRYPGNQDFAIENLSFELRQGETLAIVGENGSGKSTLIKLLLGLYMPQSGKILFNDHSLLDCHITAYRKLFSVIFQDFSFFSAGIAQNIVLDLQWDKSELDDALEQSLYRKDPYLNKIPLDTCMTKEFDEDGIVLSGGQAQKLVITRAFLKSPFVLMDEPSSELDAASEQKLNELILRNSMKKGVLIISHRLTTTRQADRILVLSHGKKVEEGSHTELMQRKGHYYHMFMTQANQYQ
ncbi:MAG TPA: ABC transporter ATP-binding protein/permease, partial [Candidatus Eisenbergiella pullistercoris]|nr:ABC transporter ATP-binding protein/permease [Candidatus Eisenbergiella pullistercoris]